MLFIAPTFRGVVANAVGLVGDAVVSAIDIVVLGGEDVIVILGLSAHEHARRAVVGLVDALDRRAIKEG